MSLTIKQRYSSLAIVLHWLIAVLIMANILIMWVLDALPEAWQRPWINTHKSIGITVLGLACLRLLWRATHTPPPLPAYAPWERLAAHAAHWVLYGLIFLLPLSGWMHDSAWKLGNSHPMVLFGVVPWFRIGAIAHQDPATKEYLHGLFGQIHTSLAYVIYAMLAVHVLGALKHQVMDRQRELQRMWFQG